MTNPNNGQGGVYILPVFYVFDTPKGINLPVDMPAVPLNIMGQAAAMPHNFQTSVFEKPVSVQNKNFSPKEEENIIFSKRH